MAVVDRGKRRNRERPVHQAADHRHGGASQQTRDVRHEEHSGQGVDGRDRRRIRDPRRRGRTKPVTARRRNGAGGTRVSGHGG